MIYNDINVERILTDSRNLFVAEGSLFVALRGERHDGERYVPDLYARGVRAFVCHKGFDTSAFPEARFFLVDNTLDELQRIAHTCRQQNKGRVVAIVGSNGKTIVKEWLAELLSGHLRMVRSPRSYNSQVGVPLSLLNIRPDTEISIIEAGISQRAEMQRLERIVSPDDVIVTNIGQAHQENFSSIEQKMHEKLQMATNAKRIFYCADQPMLRNYIEANFPNAEKISWSMANAAPYTQLLRLTDAMSQEDMMHAVSYAITLGISVDDIKQRIPHFDSVSMRLEQKEGHNNCTIIDDAYNADIDSLAIALDSLYTLGSRKGLSRTLILSDLQQTGLTNAELYKRVANLLVEKNVTRLIGIGKEISNSVVTAPNCRFFASTAEFLQSMSTADFKDEAILLKGSRNFHFEHIVALLEQKHHRTVMEVNLGALAHNIAYFRSFLKPQTKLLAMVKAYSYGTGSFEIAKLMQQQGVDYLGVAFADEGVDLRQAGITLPIIVMNPEEHSYDVMLNNALEPELSTVETIEKYSAMARRLDIEQAPIHIKIDTGMKRSGFEPTDIDSVWQTLQHCTNLRVVSAFSHLVGSDESKFDNFTNQQLSLFDEATKKLRSHLNYDFMRHILNSAGIERFAAHQCEMVRLGIGLYGVSAVDNSKLRNVVTLKSYISQIRPVAAGETVGYSRKTTLKRNSLIAVVPIGYADGLDRRLSNGVGQVLIRGKKAPIAGNVCMDICMIDVTDIPEAQVGDAVTLFGDENPVWEMSDSIGTIPYEIMTGIGRRVKRIYFYD